MIDYTKKNVLNQYATLDDFLSAWGAAERKEAIIKEMEEHGILFSELCEQINQDLDPFDLICHIVFDQPALTRRERANNVRKRNYFTKYGQQAAEILDALLTKYADSGLSDLENVDVLKVDPIKQYGTQVYILDRNKAAPARSRGKQEYLLTTKLFCGHCKEMMTGYTGTGKHGNKYHYYICNGAKKKVCDKKTIQKALIEERVVQACSELLTEEKVKYIADQVYAACKKDGDLLSVKKLKAALKEADSAIENLWVALEKGQSVDMITERIHKREAEKKELEKQLAIEIKKQNGMEYSVILSFLDYLRMLPNDNEYKRRALVNIFINAIYLYDGYFTMILNAGNRPLSIENIPLDDIEKTFENDDVGCSSNSQLVADAPPLIPTKSGK